MRNSNDRPRPAPAAQALGAMLRASDGILDILPVATFVCDARGAILQYNRRAVEIGARSRSPASGTRILPAARAIARSTARRSSARCWPKCWRAARRCATPSCRSCAWTADACSCRSTSTRCATRQGELVGAVNCFLDITERHHINAALEASRLRAREQEQRLAATYEHAAIGISEVAPDGRFLRVNEGDHRHHRIFPRPSAGQPAVTPTRIRMRRRRPRRLSQTSRRHARLLFRGKTLRPQGQTRDLDLGQFLAGARRERPAALSGARGAGHHRAQGGRAARRSS